MTKFIAGETWDSMAPGREPVSIEARTSQGSVVTTRTFADGSIQNSTVEQPVESDRSSRAIASCRVSTSGSTKTYTGCWVSETTILISAGFSVKYQTSPGAAKILETGVESIQILSLGAGWKDVKRSIVYANASSSTPATARLTLVPTGATFGTTCRLDFTVTTGGTAKTNAWF